MHGINLRFAIYETINFRIGHTINFLLVVLSCTYDNTLMKRLVVFIRIQEIQFALTESKHFVTKIQPITVSDGIRNEKDGTHFDE